MSEVKIAELKARLSAYLSDVRGGQTVIVYDRQTPVARIVPFDNEPDELVIIEASASPSTLKGMKGVRPKKPIDVNKLLQDLRKDR
jgi:antitoxin (DNA-binding transcriptional repressor) of toxin-antitoxin stability system